MTGKKVFLTGATGFIGSFLAERLIQKGYQVRCLVRTQSNLRWIADLDVECHYGSLFESQSLLQGIDGCDYIIHCAGVTKAATEAAYFKGNQLGTKNLIAACTQSRNNLSRFVHISSQAAVGPSPTIIPINEGHEPNPLTYYGRSKLAAEQEVLKHGDKIKITILRPPAVYGPRDTDVLEFFKTVSKGLIPQLGGKNKYLSLIHARDLVEGIIRATEDEIAVGETYFISSPKPYSWDDVSKTTLKILDKKGYKVSVPLTLMRAIAAVSEQIARITNKPTIVNKQKVIEMEQDFWTCSSDKAKKDLGFEAEITLENGIRETIVWYKENKWM
jgi:nucleoside-diphosphate-sugar epimerase